MKLRSLSKWLLKLLDLLKYDMFSIRNEEGSAGELFCMKKKIRDEIRKLGVSIIYLFGSRAVGRGSPLSDVDIGVVLKNPPVDGDLRDLYNKIFRVLSDQYPASKVDLVFLQTAPLALQFFAVRDGKVLFEEDPRYTADYEKRVIQEYLDFRPVLNLFDGVRAERYAKA